MTQHFQQLHGSLLAILLEAPWTVGMPCKQFVRFVKVAHQNRAELRLKPGLLQLGPPCASQLLPRGRGDLTTVPHPQLFQILRVAQDFQKILSPIQALAFGAEAPWIREWLFFCHDIHKIMVFNATRNSPILPSCELNLATFRLGHLRPRSFCHAAAGMWVHSLKFKFSKLCAWPKTSSKSAAPSIFWLNMPKHLDKATHKV